CGAAFVVGHGLLGDAQFLGQVGLGEAKRLAVFGDPASEPLVELLVFHGGSNRVGGSIEHRAAPGWRRLTIPIIWVPCVRVIFTQNPLTGFCPEARRCRKPLILRRRCRRRCRRSALPTLPL